MDPFELQNYFEGLSSYEWEKIAEYLFSLECFKNPSIWEAVLKMEEQEEENRVKEYSDEEVFTKYMEFNEKIGTPINLEEYLADRREWEYESSSEEPENLDGWEQFEKAQTEHALELLSEYKNRHGDDLFV